MGQAQHCALALLNATELDAALLIQLIQIPLQSLPALRQINTPTQLTVKLIEGALHPFISVIDKDVKQNLLQY